MLFFPCLHLVYLMTCPSSSSWFMISCIIPLVNDDLSCLCLVHDVLSCLCLVLNKLPCLFLGLDDLSSFCSVSDDCSASAWFRIACPFSDDLFGLIFVHDDCLGSAWFIITPHASTSFMITCPFIFLVHDYFFYTG